MALNDGILVNRRLRTLILANTEINKRHANILTNTIVNSKSMRLFRWTNLKDLPDKPTVLSANKVVLVDKSTQAISKIPYKCGFLNHELLMDILKFQLPVLYDVNAPHQETEASFNTTEEDSSKRMIKKMAKVTEEMVRQDLERHHELYRSYYSFTLQYWDALKKGDLHTINDRPDRSFKCNRKIDDLDNVLAEIIECAPPMPDDDDRSTNQYKQSNTRRDFEPEFDLITWNEQNYKLRGAQTKFTAHALYIDLLYYGFEADK